MNEMNEKLIDAFLLMARENYQETKATFGYYVVSERLYKLLNDYLQERQAYVYLSGLGRPGQRMFRGLKIYTLESLNADLSINSPPELCS